MKITWSIPVFSEGLGSGRGDLVRAGALIDALRSDGHEVRVVEARSRPGRTMEESVYRGLVHRMLPEGLRLALRDSAWWLRSRGHGRRVANAARRQGADVLVESQVHGVISGAVASRATGLPLVLDDVSPLEEVARPGAGLVPLSRRAFRRQCEAAALLVTPTGRIAEMVTVTESSPLPVEVLPNGVDLEAHRSASRIAGRRALGVRGEVLIGFVGSFQPWHDVSLLVRAFAALEKEALPVRLLLVGDGPTREAALLEARCLGADTAVIVVGSVPPRRIPELLAACDVGVLPGTNRYGQPMKLLEYAAAGLPSVAPDVSRVREWIADGESGVLFTPGDAGSLARALSRLVDDPYLRHRLGSRARQGVATGRAWLDRSRRLARSLERVAAADRVISPSSPPPGGLRSRAGRRSVFVHPRTERDRP